MNTETKATGTRTCRSLRAIVGTLFAIALLGGLAASPAAADDDEIVYDLGKLDLETVEIIDHDFRDWIVFNQAPQFNNYLVCVNGWVYADFVDPDGNDALLDVELWTSWTGYRTMGVSTGYHGTFWYDEIPTPASSGTVWVRATDVWGASTSWQTITMDSNGWC